MVVNSPIIHDTFYNIIQSEILKHYTQELMKPVTSNIYNYIYPYVWIICLYSILLFILTLANLLLLLKYFHHSSKKHQIQMSQ